MGNGADEELDEFSRLVWHNIEGGIDAVQELAEARDIPPIVAATVFLMAASSVIGSTYYTSELEAEQANEYAESVAKLVDEQIKAVFHDASAVNITVH